MKTGLDHEYFRSFRVGNLYFRFIKGSWLEHDGWTAERLAQLLEENGFIRTFTRQDRYKNGRFKPPLRCYVECEGKTLTRDALLKLMKGMRK